jgi:PKD repeat protein
MKHPLLILLCSILLLGNFSCKKDEPVAVTEPPVFYFRGTIGSTAYNLQAGFDNYFMYSGFTQPGGIYSFNGALSVYNCTSCGNSLQFQINDFQQSTVNGNVDIATALAGEYYPFMTPSGSPTQYYATINCGTYNGGSGQYIYHWDFGDGETVNSTSTSYSSIETHMYNHPGNYRVRSWVIFPNSVVDSTEYHIRFGIPEGELQGTFDGSAVGETITFNPSYSSAMGGPYTYNWDFGDGNTSTQSPPGVTHTYANPGVYKVHLVVTDTHGGISEMMKSCPTQYWTGPYSGFYMNPPLPLSNYSGFSNVTVTWRDASGNTYTSNNSAQPSSSYFRLLSVEDYQNNGNGEHTKKIHLNVKCKVYCQSTGDSLQIDNGDAVIAVAYQ